MTFEPVGAVNNYIARNAAAQLRQAIEEAEGAEVFAVGRCDRDFIVVEVAVLARGNMTAAPVVDPTLIRGQVVIHNHPSGNLMPSDADISVASGLSGRGIGFWIVDNAVSRIRSVTDPLMNQQGSIIVDPADIRHIFSPDGPLAARFDGYQTREGQIEMAEAVSSALSDGAHLIVEAGTGTGKSLAYLVPAFLWAKRNNTRVVVSTNTINLQEQLIHKDIPYLAVALGEPIRASLVKGRSNYLCLRKLEKTRADMDHSLEPGQRGAFAQISEWAQSTQTGDKSTMEFEPDPEVWEIVASEGDMCPHGRCPFYTECFFHKARRSMEGAQVLVVNHHILFADSSIRSQIGQEAERAVLPRYKAVIIDEAHNASGIASEYFGRSVSRLAMVRTLNALYRKERPRGASGTVGARGSQAASSVPDYGALVSLRGDLLSLWPDESRQTQVRACSEIIDLEAIPAVLRVGEAGDTFFDSLRMLLRQSQSPGTGRHGLFGERRIADADAGPGPSGEGEGGGERVIRVTDSVRKTDTWDREVWPAHERYASSLEALADVLARLSGLLAPESEENGEPAQARDARGADSIIEGDGPDLASHAVELSGFAGRAREMASSLRFAMLGQAEDHVYWIETAGSGQRSNVYLNAAPIAGGKEIAEHLLEAQEAVVFTSATLAVASSFEYAKRDLGLDLVDPGRVRELLVPSPFDFENQVLLGVADDVPDPDSRGWEDALVEALSRILSASDGRAFVLFTSYRLLGRVARDMEAFFRERGIRLLKQGDAPRHALLSVFRDDIRSVLFGTSSFWEGVDVPGEALSCVVMPRLPFTVPSHPVVEARIEDIRARGGDAFRDYTLPNAVLRFKQGFGRLIRTTEDRGSVVVLDSRTARKYYGRYFMSALPNCNTMVGRVSEIAGRLADWLPAANVP